MEVKCSVIAAGHIRSVGSLRRYWRLRRECTWPPSIYMFVNFLIALGLIFLLASKNRLVRAKKLLMARRAMVATASLSVCLIQCI